MPTLLEATFTALDGTTLPDYTPEVGGPFVDVTGVWTVETGRAQAPALTPNAFSVADVGEADVTIVVDVVVPSAASFALGVGLRVSDANNGWTAVFERDGSGTGFLGIFERTGGVNTLRAFTPLGANPAGTTVTLTVVASGASISVSSSTGETASYPSVSTGLTVTSHGLACYTDSSYAAGAFDNLLITGGSAPVASTACVCWAPSATLAPCWPLVLVDQGVLLMLAGLDYVEVYSAGLYSADVTPTVDTVLGDLTLPPGTQSNNGEIHWTTLTLDAPGRYSALPADPVIVTLTGATGATVHGWYVTDSGGDLVAAGRLPSPVVVPHDGWSYTFAPRLIALFSPDLR